MKEKCNICSLFLVINLWFQIIAGHIELVLTKLILRTYALQGIAWTSRSIRKRLLRYTWNWLQNTYWYYKKTRIAGSVWWWYTPLVRKQPSSTSAVDSLSDFGIGMWFLFHAKFTWWMKTENRKFDMVDPGAKSITLSTFLENILINSLFFGQKQEIFCCICEAPIP